MAHQISNEISLVMEHIACKVELVFCLSQRCAEFDADFLRKPVDSSGLQRKQDDILKIKFKGIEDWFCNFDDFILCIVLQTLKFDI
jgi:hypothetical protein